MKRIWLSLAVVALSLGLGGTAFGQEKKPATFGALAATQCGLAFFGIDNVLFASDTPFEPAPGVYIRETIHVIENLGLTDAEKDRIYRTNAERLLKLA